MCGSGSSTHDLWAPLVTSFLFSKLNLLGPSVCWGMLHPMPSWAVEMYESLRQYEGVFVILYSRSKVRRGYYAEADAK